MRHILFKTSLLLFLFGFSQTISAQTELKQIIKHYPSSTNKNWNFQYDNNDQLKHMSIVDANDSVSVIISYNNDQLLNIHSTAVNNSSYNFDLDFFYNAAGQIDSITHLEDTTSTYYLLTYSGNRLDEVQQYRNYAGFNFLDKKETYIYQGDKLHNYYSYNYFASAPNDYEGDGITYTYNDIDQIKEASFHNNSSNYYSIRNHSYSDDDFLIHTDFTSYAGDEVSNQSIHEYTIDENINFSEVVNPLKTFKALSYLSFTSVSPFLKDFQIMLSDRLVQRIENENGELLYTFVYDNYDGSITSNSQTAQKFNRDFSVYPNPVINQLHLPKELNNIAILDIQGRQINTILLASNTIDVSHLTKGIYILKGVNEYGNEINVRFVK